MTNRIYNFSAGPATLPEPVLEEAQQNLLSLNESGIGILEHSHRGKAFTEVINQTNDRIRELASIPSDYQVLYLQGGASSQFFMIPMNFLEKNRTADYLITGSWSKKAVHEARRFGNVHLAASSEDDQFRSIPEEFTFSSSPDYVHFTSNNTIFGTQYNLEPACPGDAFLVCDASSDIFSRPIDISKYGILYAGAQKNLGPSGVTLVIIRNDLIERGALELPTMLQYRTHAEKNSLYHTPPTFGIYLMGLVFQWMIDQGGLDALRVVNERKAKLLYQFLDQSELFQGVVNSKNRSSMNVTFRTNNEELDAKFVQAAEEASFGGLKGHRSVGGMRASIYNAFPEQGVTDLIQFMHDFESQNL